jgi:hypothetical protein
MTIEFNWLQIHPVVSSECTASPGHRLWTGAQISAKFRQYTERNPVFRSGLIFIRHIADEIDVSFATTDSY